MKILLFIFIFYSSVFAFDDIYDTLKECSEVKDDVQRLNCYDTLALTKKPKTKFQIKGEELTSKCILCHGKNWNLSTNGERLVKDMTPRQIHKSLLDYKYKRLDSTVMNFHMSKYSDEEIELIVKYIMFKVNQ